MEKLQIEIDLYNIGGFFNVLSLEKDINYFINIVNECIKFFT